MTADIPIEQQVDEGRFKHVLRRDELDGYSGGREDVYSPQIIQHPTHNGQRYLLYNDVGDSIFAVPVNKDLQPTGSEKTVVAPSDIGKDNIAGFQAIYDGENDEFVFFAGATSSGAPFDLVAIAVSVSDNSWSVSGSSTLITDTLLEHAAAVKIRDGVIFGGVRDANGNLPMWGLNDLSSRPLPSSPDSGGVELLFNLEQVAEPVHVQFIQVSQNVLGILYETDGVGNWGMNMAYSILPPKGTANGRAITSQSTVAPVVGNSSNNGFTHAKISHIAGRPLMVGQYITAKNGDVLNRSSIAAYEPDPDILDPTKMLPMSGTIMTFSSGPSRFIPTFGASAVRVLRREPDDGTLTLHEKMSPQSDSSTTRDAVDSSGSTKTFTTDPARYVWDDPLPYIAIESSVSARGIDVQLVP